MPGSACDWPTAYFWRELAAHFPAAKIVLTTRDPAKWFDSATQTIFNTMSDDVNPDSFGVAVIRNKVFSGNVADKAHVTAVLEANTRDVVAGVPRERLLVYQVSEGWPRLCAFLGLPEPAEPFPLTNTTGEFRGRMAQRTHPGQAG
jgi:Sulfotransferase domain